MHVRYRIAVAALMVSALVAGSAASAQDGDASAPKRPVAGQPSSGDAAKPPAQDKTPKPDGGDSTGPIGPSRLAVRAQYDAGMQTVDSGIAELAPFVGRTVIGLKRLALGRPSADSSVAERQHRHVAAGLRGLAVAEQRLRQLDIILDRWRIAPPTTPQEQAAMLAGVFRRSGDIGILRRRIACGRYFGATAAQAIRNGASRGAVRVPRGC
jgi:hypothetical protein